MNCQEVKSYVENILPGEDPCAELCLTGHIAECPECSRFMEGQKKVHVSLALLRESVSSPSSTLDEIVLANYRKHVAGLRTSVEAARMPKPGLRPSIRWAFGLAAAIALVTILLWPRKQPGVAAIQPVISPPAISSTRFDSAQNIPIPQRSGREKRRNGTPKRTQAAVSSASMSNPVPEGFRSLMYCDELSCGGAMDVVRIELQPSDMGLIATAQQGRNAISADVLVGADGIARGIRIVR
ncbi:MAG TPA: hypothetical protein VGL74_05425 [Terriglobales bacterium]|jgi:hypothetical protein